MNESLLEKIIKKDIKENIENGVIIGDPPFERIISKENLMKFFQNNHIEFDYDVKILRK